MQSNIYAVSASDPVILFAAMFIVIVISAIATTIPALRASRLDPARALRADG